MWKLWKGRNPFWSRAGFNSILESLMIYYQGHWVAIPFDPGQVSTRENYLIIPEGFISKVSQSLLIQGRFQQSNKSEWQRKELEEVSQSLLIQGRFQQKRDSRNKKFWKTAVAIPFDPGQVSTLLRQRKGMIGHGQGSQSLLIQGRFQRLKESGEQDMQFIKSVAIPFDPGQVSTWKVWRRGMCWVCSYGRNPFWSRAGFNLIGSLEGRGNWGERVAIPFDPGQVST